MSDQVANVRSNLLTALADTLTPPSSPTHVPGLRLKQDFIDVSINNGFKLID